MKRVYRIDSFQFLKDLLKHLESQGYKWFTGKPLSNTARIKKIWLQHGKRLGIVAHEELQKVSYGSFYGIMSCEKDLVRVIDHNDIKLIKQYDKHGVYERIDKLHDWFNKENQK